MQRAPEQLIQPLFVAEGDLVGPVKSMPGIARLSLGELQRGRFDVVLPPLPGTEKPVTFDAE